MFYHEQRHSPDGQVTSVQRHVLPSPLTALPDSTLMAEAGWLYWEYLRRFGAPVLRVEEQGDGSVTVGLPGLALLAFGRPSVLRPAEEAIALRYPIGTGWAVRPGRANAGYLEIGVARDAVSLAVEGYFPRLSRPLYNLTQSPLHVRIARGYLGMLAREVAAWQTPT